MSDWWIYLTDNIGIAAAAVSGAMIAIERRLDLFGILFLGVITALGGGVTRDLLLGSTPPRFFTSYPSVLIAVLAATAVFLIAKLWNGWRNPAVFERINRIHNLFDAVGLAAFTVTGTQLAMAAGHENNAFMCVFMGMTTAVGGGILRDMMTQRVPYVLCKRIYAVASIVGGLMYWTLCHFGLVPALAQLIAMLLIVLIRAFATIFRWNLPHIALGDVEKTASSKQGD